jgi:hypothetical protein
MGMLTASVRRPAVAGYYYPQEPATLAAAIDELAAPVEAPSPALALIVPHGSLRHAGAVAGAAYRRSVIPRHCILVGPSHAPQWMPWSLMAAGAYRTPLGDVPVDMACAEALRRRCAFLEPDAAGQRGEHSLEVQVPFLQRRAAAELAIVPILVGAPAEAERLRLAEALAQVVRLHEEPVLLIASSDLSHFETRERGAAQDRAILARIAALDPDGLLATVREEQIAMCGAVAVSIVLEASRRLGATAACVAAYATSADAGGDPGSCTGYAGVAVS